MTIRTASHPFSLETLRAPRQTVPATRAPMAVAGLAGWMERLAAWAERQPVHHRLGSWEQLRIG
jgi:hypothetical protein